MNTVSKDRLTKAIADAVASVLDSLASEAAGAEAEAEAACFEEEAPAAFAPEGVCVPKMLPKNLMIQAAKTAIEINPMNAPLAGAHMLDVQGTESLWTPQRISVLTSKYWQSSPQILTVSFMEPAPDDLKRRILEHFNAWQCGLTFTLTNGVGKIRITRGKGGYWSYLGTDVLSIPQNRPTMCLSGFTMSTSEAEFRRVVRHEVFHTMGGPHEHMRKELIARLHREKTYAYFRRTQGWDRETVDSQVLTPLDERSLMSTPPDQDSIMAYQLPGSITLDGRPITGGADINDTDRAFARKIYPPSTPPPPPPPTGRKVRIVTEYDEDANEARIVGVEEVG